MYDELVKRLRSKGCQICPICREAADAIEELSKQNKKWEEAVKIALDFIPRWISVEERLPSEELCFYLCYTDEGVIVECLWTNNKYGLGPFGEWGWRLMDVPQHQRVTHWMPLPKPPKEENDED